MVLFREVFIEKNEAFIERNGQVISLKNLKFVDLCLVMNNGDWNVVGLKTDRAVYYDKHNPGIYGVYDLKVLEN
jgi:hypothetical protein